jgi:pimeloyl-ACP methyl ester carboxylesterase
MDWWEDEFCERLAAGPRFVIRYDHRDTGQSVSYPPGKPGYTGDDLTDDAVGVLDGFGLRRAHLVGLSMGGGIAQEIALDHPNRVASLTLISTSSAVPQERDLPGMTKQGRAAFGALGEPDWSDRSAVIDYGVAFERACAGGSPHFDEARTRELWDRVIDRAANIESSFTNHDLMHDGESRRRPPLSELAVPTLVIHGTLDPLIPPAHGEALADQIHGADLLSLEDVGHGLPRAAWDVAVPAILELTERA